MSELSQTEMIARYLQGELDAKDLEQFNARLATDDAFKREVELQRTIIKNITRAGRHALRSQLKQYHQQIIHETEATSSQDISGEATVRGRSFKNRSRPATRKRALLMAACVVIALTAIGLGYYAYLSPERIFNDEFKPYAIRTTRGSSAPADIVSLYRDHDYNHYLSAYQAREVKSLQEIFLAGNVYLIKADAARAIQCFRQVMIENEKRAAEDQRYYEDSEYFLALAYLQNNEPDKAEILFRKIMAAPQHPYNHEVGNGLLWKISVVRFKLGVND
ncbi:hypothetical protein KK083_03890 [Fulvivirgaceae bacterium PWU4]|uniref:Tetratricopeptide repeat protein n=1 Tax=Chryseosolibacter histidini TaxID=2782349 RepID=A0AAP2DI43_9BACT|nr:hypothetical protein [Chryseosolibacter histidini]MBT1696004.1 hypothetical protein [Chryseosolibacter histidini]